MKALLYSGGLDSTAAWFALGKPKALYVGGRWGSARWANEGELFALDRQVALSAEFAHQLTRKELDFRPFMRKGEYMLPRLEILIMAAWAEGFDGVMVAYTNEDMPVDHAANVTARLEKVMPFVFTVKFPFVEIGRPELVKLALDAGAPEPFLLASHSCVRQSASHCGLCNNCKQRAAALAACGLETH